MDTEHSMEARLPERRSWKRRLPLVIFLVLASLLYFKFNLFKSPKQLNVASLNLETLNNRPLDPSRFEGKAVVLNFWAPWCGPCQLETPWLQKLQMAHKDELVVIGVVDDADTYQEAKMFAITHGVTYPIVKKSRAMVDAIGTIDGVPTTFYISPSGAVVHTVSGAISEAGMESYATDAIRR
jgi:thiol-disulfide isomerase/thioredoxin